MIRSTLICLTILISGSLFGQTFTTQSRSMYADVKAYHVGGVVTVLIVEIARASRESSVESSSRSNVATDGAVKGDLGKYSKFLPTFGMSSGLSNSHDGSEGTSQKEQLAGKITAMVTEVTGNGLLKIKGERVVEVNGEKNLMELEGLVRPRDIGTDNTVYSYKIADANITYKKDGFVNDILKPGRIQKWVTWIIGFGLLGLAVVGA